MNRDVVKGAVMGWMDRNRVTLADMDSLDAVEASMAVEAACDCVIPGLATFPPYKDMDACVDAMVEGMATIERGA
jgi:acyl carrier protein